MVFRWIFFIAFLLQAIIGSGQDDHYWSQQFGATNTSMGGAVVGGVRDNSAIYYNPGAQSFIENPSLSVDANLYKYDKIFIRNGAGQDVNLNSAQLSIYPQIVAGLVNLINLPRFKFGYAVLTKNFNNVLMNARFTDRDIESNPNPTQEFVGAFDYSNQLNEQWFGFCISYKANKNNGFGLSLFGSYRAQTYSLTNFIRNITYRDSTAWFSTTNVDENIRYKTFMMIAKLGWAFETGRWRLGVMVSLPSIRFYGTGDIQREISLYAASDNPGDTSVSFLVLDRKTSVKTVYHHPLSIAAGAEYRTSKTRLAFSAEYFAGISSYYMMHTESDPLVYPTWVKDSISTQPYLKAYLDIRNQSMPVLNVAIGMEQYLSKSFSLLLGARTDFSSFKSPEKADILLHSSGEWDLYHISAGLSYNTPKQSITLGFNYTFSPEKSLAPYAELNPLSQSGFHSKVFAQSFGLVLGYTHYLKN